MTLYARAMTFLLSLSWGSVVNPVFLETGVAIALARHFYPASEKACRREQQAIAQVGRVVRVFLEGRDGDLLVVRIVLKAARRQRHGRLIRLAVGSRLQIGVGEGRGAREIERHDRVVEITQQRMGRATGGIDPGGLLLDHPVL